MTENTNNVSEDILKEEALEELRKLIQQGIRKDGLENTVTEIGVSIFQNEAVIHELLCLCVATQRLLLDKGLVTPEEMDKVISETVDAHSNSMQEAMDTLEKEA